MRRAGSSRAAAVAARERRVASCLLALVSLAAAAVAADNGPPTSAPRAARAAPPAAPADPLAGLLATGWDHLDQVNYPAARETFEEVLEANPSRAQRAEARFGLGHVWQHRRPGADVEKAARLYRQVAEEFPDTPSGPLALMALARLADAPEYEKARDRAKARATYRKIIARYPKQFIVHEAVLRLAMTYLEDLGDSQAAQTGLAMLRDHLAAHPGNFLAAAMHLHSGTTHQRRGEFPDAVRHWIAADAADQKAAETELTPKERSLPPRRRANRVSRNRAMDSGTRASLYFRIARVAETKLRDHPLAVTWYERIVYEIVRDNKYYVSKLSAERCRKLAEQAGVDVPPHPLAGEEPRP